MELTKDARAGLDAQTAVLGCLMLSGDRLAGEIFQRVEAADFSSAPHRALFEAAAAAFLADEPVDAVTVVSRAGAAYEPLARSILDLTPTAANWEPYCKTLHEEGRLHRLQALAYEAMNARSAEEAAELLLQAQQSLTDRKEHRIRRMPRHRKQSPEV